MSPFFSKGKPARLGFMISGAGSNMQAILKAIEAKHLRAKPVMVFSDKKDAKGLVRAAKFKVPFQTFSPKDFSSRNAYEREIAALFQKSEVDLIICAGYMRVLHQPVLQAFPHKILNIHPSLLPSFPGLKAQRQAIEAGVKISGCTVHFVDEGVDTGPIIAQSAVAVKPGDTEETLAKRILKAEHALYWRAIDAVLKGS
ncbi:MAG: phosphoribosylglycinamide formyltransferase [Leptospiraceae bacterium]|nr:phosphoribosylglycinamide formyltransferase [Leptospiraceae bacterium]